MTDNSDKPVVIVTGSSGYIGSAIVKKLAAKYRVIGFDRDAAPHPPAEAECVCVDVTDQASIDAAFERSGLRASPVIETTSTALMRRLVREGEGITLLNRLDVAEEMHDGSLVFVPLRDATLPAQTLTLETRAAQAPSPAAELFANHVTACLDELLAP